MCEGKGRILHETLSIAVYRLYLGFELLLTDASGISFLDVTDGFV